MNRGVFDERCQLLRLYSEPWISERGEKKEEHSHNEKNGPLLSTKQYYKEPYLSVEVCI
jgi:hypothetical protein